MTYSSQVKSDTLPSAKAFCTHSWEGTKQTNRKLVCQYKYFVYTRSDIIHYHFQPL
jgi:hypothetical protein